MTNTAHAAAEKQRTGSRLHAHVVRANAEVAEASVRVEQFVPFEF
jgi:hypothetical protein